MNVSKANVYPRKAEEGQFKNITIFLRTDLPNAEGRLRIKILDVFGQLFSAKKLSPVEYNRLCAEAKAEGGPFHICNTMKMFNYVPKYGKNN